MIFECESLLMFFEKYQTFVIGILGFGGVMFTIFMNARLSRIQHDRQINHEREALRAAIYTELDLNQKMIENRCQMAQEKEGVRSAFYPEHISNQVYLQLIKRIGLLPTSEIKVVMEAYALLSDLPKRLQFLSTDHDPSFDRPGYILIDSEHAETAIGIHKNFLLKIELALKIMRDNRKK